MARSTARVLVLLEVLQSGGTHTAAALARRLEVDERTVRRYIAQLVEMDVPVETVRGRYGGYRLGVGYRMPPLMLTDDEAMAVLLGLVAGRRTGLVGASPAAEESATAKVLRVLPARTRRRLDALLATLDLPAVARSFEGTDAQTVLLLAAAARQRHPVVFGHRSREGAVSERTLLPYGLVAHAGRWYVAGHDATRGEIRTFRLDRISAPTVRDGTFAAPDDFDTVAAVLDSLASTPWRHEVAVRVQGTRAGISARLRPGLARVDELPDEPGWVRVELRAESLDWVPAVLAGLDTPFIVERPVELRGLVGQLADRLRAAADGEL